MVVVDAGLCVCTLRHGGRHFMFKIINAAVHPRTSPDNFLMAHDSLQSPPPLMYLPDVADEIRYSYDVQLSTRTS
jgi:hypothetical protein